jgi:hypothetical protein
VSLAVTAHHRNGRMHSMGTTRHVAQHASRIIKIFRLAKDFAFHVHRGVGCNHDDIEIFVSLCNNMCFALCKSLHVCKRRFKFKWSFINVSWLDVKRHFTFAKCFV